MDKGKNDDKKEVRGSKGVWIFKNIWQSRNGKEWGGSKEVLKQAKVDDYADYQKGNSQQELSS